MAAAEPARPRVLFLCTGNSCRSQMAEGWARALRGDRLEACSAGTNPHGLNPLAVRAMAEVGIDISTHRSRRPEEVLAALGGTLDVVVTVCDSAHESCPVLPGARTVHRRFDDPPRLAAGAASDDAAMVHYRRVRDEIRAFVETLPEALFHATDGPVGRQVVGREDEVRAGRGHCEAHGQPAKEARHG